MKKKRLSMFSLLIALTLTLGACDDLEDLFPSGSDSDESTELAGDEDPNTGVNPNEDENENEDDNDDDEKGNEPVNKDVTITLSTTSISVKENETEYFSVFLSDSEASILTVSPENATYIEVGPSGSDSEYYVKGLAAGLTSITITAGGEGFNTATASISVTVDYADSFTYQMYVDNEESVPLTGWYYNSETSFTFLPKLNIYNRGVLTETKDLTTSEVELSVTNDEGSASSIISIDGLTISPAGAVGVVTLTLSYRAEIDGTVEPLTYTISVDEVYSKTHSVEITAGSVPESITVGDSGFDIGVKLTTVTTAGSTGTAVPSTVDANAGDVSITFNPVGSMTASGLHIIPSAVDVETEVTITVIWTEYSTEESASATAKIKVMPKEGAVYSLSITNESEFTNWYSEDSAKTMEISITSSDENEGTIDTGTLVSEGKIATSSTNENVANVDGLTVTPVGKGETTILVYWTEHTEAHATLSLTILEHSYKLEITNKAELEQDWSIEDGSRSLSISLTSDREDITKEASTSNVTITYDSDAFTTSDGGFALTPVQTGTYTITATWVDDNLAIGAEGVDSFTVIVNDTVKVTELALSQSSISWESPSSTTLTATLKGKDGATPTNQGVSWSVSGADSITIDDDGGTTATVTASAYGATATITATSIENSDISDSCVVIVAEKVIEYTPALVEKKVLTSTVVNAPDNDGVYVLGYKGEEDTFITFDTSAATTDSYGVATAVRTVPSNGEGYVLEVGSQYVTTSGTLGNEGVTVTIEDDGKIASSSTYLGWDENSLVWSASPTNYLYLLDMDYVLTYDSITSSGDVDYDIYFAADVNGDYYYWDGTASSGHGETTDDISKAAVMTVTCIEDNRYYLKNGNNYMYISSSSNTAFYTKTSEQVLAYDVDGNYWLGDPDDSNVNTRTFAWYGTDKQIRTYEASNNSAGTKFKLVAGPEEASLKGITLHSTTDSVNSGESTALTYSLYPSAIHHADLTWSSSDENAATVVDGVVYGNSTSEGVTITAKCGNVEASIVLAIAGADPTYIGTLALGASCGTMTDPNTNTKYSTETLQNLLDDAYTGSGTITAGDTDNCYRTSGNTSGTGLNGSSDCFRIGASSNAGSFTFSFEESDIKVGRIEIVIAYYDSANQTINVNGDTSFTVTNDASAYTDWNAVPSISFSFTPSNSVKFDAVTASKHRHLVYSIALYTE